MAENHRAAGRSGSPGAGGFLPNTLPSPAPTNLSSRSSVTGGLPHPRAKALRPGSFKEDNVRAFVEKSLFQINRRYVKKFGTAEPDDDLVGYRSISELFKDLDAIINVLWLSGTPSLQIPYFLNIANELTTWLNTFPPSPAATFATLRKLDHCFASLLMGQDIETKETLPGFENGLRRSGMSRTDMVRCKNLVEQTRILIVDVLNRAPEDFGGGNSRAEDSTETEADETSTSMDEGPGRPTTVLADDDDDSVDMDAARVYENTIIQLGVALGGGQALGDIRGL